MTRRRVWLLAPAVAFVLAASSAGAAPECLSAVDRGQALRDSQQLRAARREFIKCAKETCAVVVRTDCIKWLADVDARLPTIVVRAVDDSGRDLDPVSVSVDGILEERRIAGRALTLDPGPHILRFEHPGAGPIDKQIVAREGEHDRIIDVVFTRATPPSAPSASASASATPKRSSFPVAGVVFTGLAALGLGAFVFFAATGKSDVDDLRSSCAPRCASSDVDAARTKILIANIGLGAAVASGILAGYFFLSPTPDGQGVSAVATGRF